MDMKIGSTTKISIATKIGIKVFSSILKKFSISLIIMVNNLAVKVYLTQIYQI